MRGRSARRGPSPAAARAALALAAALLSAGCASSPSASAHPASAAGSARGAPVEFAFPADADGVVVSSETTRGRVTALVFVATYDLASQLLAQQLAQAAVSFVPRINAAAVVMEAPLYADLLPTYRETLSLPYPVVMADFATQAGGGPFGSITRVPTLIVLDRAGREVARHQGALDQEQLAGTLRAASQRSGPR